MADRPDDEVRAGGGTPAAQVDALSDEIAHLRAALADAPEARARPRGAAARDEGPARPGGRPEREAELHAARGARAHRHPARRGRQAHPAAVGLRRRRRQERRRHRRRPHQRAQDAGRAAPRHRPRHARPRRRGRAQRELQRRAGPRARDHRRGRHDQGGARRRRARPRRRAGRRGAGLRAGRRRSAACTCAPATRCASTSRTQPAAREAAPARGRGPAARGGARHLLRRHRRPRRPDRADRRRRRAAVPVPRAVRRAPPAGAEGHPALRPARAAARR